MKKLIAAILVLAMILALGTTALAQGGSLTLEQAKQTALQYVGVSAADAVFTKAHRDRDNGREVFELGFFANGVEYDVDIDAVSGAVTDFNSEYHGGGGDDWDDLYDYDDEWLDWFDWDD